MIDYSQLTEEMLFNRYTGGDMAAFDALLKRTKGLVYSLITHFVYDRALADEIFQDVFLKICKNKDQFRESVSFKSWIATIARNTCIDHIRHMQRSLKTDSLDANFDTDDSRSLAQTVASSDMGPGEHLTIHVETNEMEALLKKLPAEQRETFYLKVVMDLTFEEIGATMRCSTNTAKSRHRYALETLRGLVKRKKILEKAV